MERFDVSFCMFLGSCEFVLVLWQQNGLKKNDHELMLTILILLGSLFLAEKTSLHRCVLKRKKMPFVGSNKQKKSGGVDDSPLGKFFRDNVRVGLFCNEPCKLCF